MMMNRWIGCSTRLTRWVSTTRISSEKVPAKLALKQEMLREMEERAAEDACDGEPIPRVTIDKVTVSFARSGGAGGQNVNKVNTKVDMRFNVMAAYWLPFKLRLKLSEMEKNRINANGELVVSSTKTRTQKGNIDDALEKLQAILDEAAYVPPPPSEETKKRINKLAEAENQKRLLLKKKIGNKKASRKL